MLIQRKIYSYAEYVAFQALPEHAERLFELIDGEIVEKLASFTPSKLAARIAYYLTGHVIERDIGDITVADGGYMMDDNNTFIPDVAYISKERLPQEPEREAPVPPDLAVEVKSPTDSKRAMRRKAEKYLAFGTKIVWLFFPDEESVEVYVADEDVQSVGIDGMLDGGDVLPGFKLPVRDIFKS
jgi:Uma2 family endonuclease